MPLFVLSVLSRKKKFISTRLLFADNSEATEWETINCILLFGVCSSNTRICGTEKYNV